MRKVDDIPDYQVGAGYGARLLSGAVEHYQVDEDGTIWIVETDFGPALVYQYCKLSGKLEGPDLLHPLLFAEDGERYERTHGRAESGENERPTD